MENKIDCQMLMSNIAISYLKYNRYVKQHFYNFRNLFQKSTDLKTLKRLK